MKTNREKKGIKTKIYVEIEIQTEHDDLSPIDLIMKRVIKFIYAIKITFNENKAKVM